MKRFHEEQHNGFRELVQSSNQGAFKSGPTSTSAGKQETICHEKLITYLNSVTAVFSFLKKSEGWFILKARGLRPLLYCMAGTSKKFPIIGENAFPHREFLTWLKEKSQYSIAFKFFKYLEKNGKINKADECEEDMVDHTSIKEDTDGDGDHPSKAVCRLIEDYSEKQGVVLINQQEKKLEFPSQVAAAAYLGCTGRSVGRCVNGNSLTVRGHKAYRATISTNQCKTDVAIEVEDDDDDDDDDKEEKEEEEECGLVEDYCEKRGVVLINKQGKKLEFPSQVAAAAYLGCTGRSVGNCVNGNSLTVRGHNAYRATISTNQCTKTQKKAEKSLIKSRSSRNGVILVNENGEEFEFPSQAKACRYLRCKESEMSRCFRNNPSLIRQHRAYRFLTLKDRAMLVNEGNRSALISQNETSKVVSVVNNCTSSFSTTISNPKKRTTSSLSKQNSARPVRSKANEIPEEKIESLPSDDDEEDDIFLE